ncbi:MAG: O-antigen ligase family protein [Macromonas sp.]
MVTSGVHPWMFKNVLGLLLVWPVFWTVRGIGLLPRWLFWGASTAATVAAVLIMPQVWSGVERVELRAIPNSIPLGNLSLLLGAVGSVAWLFRRELSVPRWQLAWSALGLVAGIWVSIASGSRGGWLALPIMGWVYSLAQPRWQKRHRWGLVLGVMLLTGIAILVVPAMQQRFIEGWQDIVRYHQHMHDWQADQILGSLDRRLEMWRLGALAFAQAPWWGLGWTGFDALVQTAIYQGQTHPEVMLNGTLWVHQHLHNEVMTTAARLGLVGLLALWWLWWGGWRWFSAGLAQHDPHARAYSVTGLLVHSSIITFALTDSMFGLPIHTSLYAVLLGAAAGGLRYAERCRNQAAVCKRTMPA